MDAHSLLKRGVAAAVSVVPCATLGRIAGTSVLPAYFHSVGKNQPAHIRHLYACKSEKDFERDIDYLMGHYRLLELSEYVRCIREGLNPGRPGILLTIDDGLSELADFVVPLLLRKGAPATLFVCSDLAENRTLAWDHVVSLVLERIGQDPPAVRVADAIRRLLGTPDISQESMKKKILPVRRALHAVVTRLVELLGIDVGEYLQRAHPYLGPDELVGLQKIGFAIGAHSVDHPRYTDLTLPEQLRQTLDSAAWVRNRIRPPVLTFAFPYSDAGAGPEFFSSLEADGTIAMTFGTGGLIDSPMRLHVQRMSLEAPQWPARTLVALHTARRMGHRLNRKSTPFGIGRPQGSGPIFTPTDEREP